MSTKISLHDVAEKAGVGIATVDRVLNERGNVSVETTRKVLEAARVLHMKRILPDVHQKLMRIEVLLARPELPLIARMNHEFRRLANGIDRSVVIQRTILKDEKPETLARAIRATGCNGIIVYCQEHASINAAIAEIKDRGVPVVTMISDLPQSARLAYAGTNHYQAGRTAGYFMVRMVAGPGPILVLCNHLGFQSHSERVHGFRDYLNEHRPDLNIAAVLEGGDDQDRSELLLRAALKKGSETVGIYNVGAANRAVAAALRGRPRTALPIYIGHELTDNTRAMLRDGFMTLVIDQNPEQQAQFALEVLLHHFGFAGLSWLTEPYQTKVPITLYGPENLVG